MKKILAYLVIFTFVIGAVSSANILPNKKASQVQSTEGVEVTETTAKAVASSKNDKSEARLKKKNRNKFLRNISKIERYENSKRIKLRDMEFLETRLNKKQNLLQELGVQQKETDNQNETTTEKGEN